ncbi:dTMP kinase [mine drainage metagenome]|uniref:dTMP kinase n=1 Tax=mine drainage metagenome TaxID=410659 RepID=T1CL15_9ZZZZ
MFIAFEGIDGAGKSTQARILYDALRQKNKVFLTKEPSEGIIGRSIKELLHRNDLSPLAMQMLFSADREEHVSKVIMPKINEGYHVISDRYVMSTLAYGIAAGIDKKRLDGICIGMPEPTMTFVLDISADKAYERLKGRGGEVHGVREPRIFGQGEGSIPGTSKGKAQLHGHRFQR